MKRILLLLMVMMPILTIHAQAPMAGGEWKDNTGRHINAHGGCIINYKGTYYWYGESVRQETHCIVLWASVAIHRKTYRTGRTKE